MGASSPALAAEQDGPRFKSAFTDLHKCKIAKHGEAADDLTRKCTGVLGYSLLLQESDARMSIDVKSPRGKVHPLEYWNVVSNEVTPRLARVARNALLNGDFPRSSPYWMGSPQVRLAQQTQAFRRASVVCRRRLFPTRGGSGASERRHAQGALRYPNRAMNGGSVALK
jgi:hypothetical protein